MRRPAALSLLRLARGRPASDSWGWDRGRPIDRLYIEGFLREHAADIRGRVLEVKDDEYARVFGRDPDRVAVLDVDPANPAATLVADLASADALPESAYDCFILTQTLQYVFDVRAAVRNAARVLVPGGVLLATLPGISRVGTSRAGAADELWRFTPAACRLLAAREFGDEQALVRSFGNALTASAFVAGLAVEDVRPRRLLAEHDERFPLVVAIRAVRR